MNKFKRFERSCGRKWYECTEKNGKGESLVVEITECENPGGKNSLPYLWKKHGFTDRVYETWLHISTYVTDADGRCWNRYCPMEKLSEDGKRRVVNFEWLLEVSEENERKLLDETYKRFMEA